MKTKSIMALVGFSFFGVGVTVLLFVHTQSSSPKLPIIRKAPDFELVDQDGHLISLNRLAGRVKVLSLIYARCNMPSMCPLTTQKFVRLQSLMGETLKQSVVLLLISFDTESDTPEALRKYGQLHAADFSSLHLLRGKGETVQTLSDSYNLIVEKHELQNGVYYYRHSMMTYLIDKENYIRKIYIGNTWEPEDMSRNIRVLLRR